MVDTKQKEIWRTYPEIPFIEASNLGRVRTKDRVITYKDGRKHFYKGRVLKQLPSKKGYLYVHISMNGKDVHISVHRIIATCFIPNHNNYPEVNHIDNDPTNNAVSNLEWCTDQYNQNYKNNFRTSPADVFGRSVIAVNPETSEVLWFKTQHEAARQLGVDPGNISKVVNGYYNQTGGWWFCYANEKAVEKTKSKFGDKVFEKVEKLMNDNCN